MTTKDTNTPPFFTVIVPTYNRSKTVVEAIDSVLDQTFDDYELIVVDDGSTDQTAEILSQRYADSQINYVYQRNRGKAGVRNTGIKLALGEYLAFLDSDDKWKPEKLERQAAFIREHEDVDIVYGPVEVIDEANQPLDAETRWFREKFQNQHRRGETYENLSHDWVLFTSNFVIRRSLLEKVGMYDESISHLEDVDLYLRLALMGHSFYYLDELLTEYRVHEGNTQTDNHFQGLISVAEKHLGKIAEGVYKPHQPSLAQSHFHLNIAGSHYTLLDDFPRMRSAVIKATWLKPTETLMNSRTVLHFFLTFMPKSWLIWVRSKRKQ